MKQPTRLQRILIGLGLIILTLILGYMLIRPFHLSWGATSAEVDNSMPGDLAAIGWTRAIEIDARPEAIWPWLVQFGQGRGGWYSYDWLENLLGFDIHSAKEIMVQYQNPPIGEPICMSGSFCVSNVFIAEPYHYFGWQAVLPDNSIMWTFIFELVPVGDARTRLIVRESFDATAMPAPALFILEMPDVVMELKMLDTLKQRAEGIQESPLTIPLEIGLWLTTFIPAIVAGVLTLQRREWRIPLALGLVSIFAVQVITFLFLPLWGRGLLALALWAATIWVVMRKDAA